MPIATQSLYASGWNALPFIANWVGAYSSTSSTHRPYRLSSISSQNSGTFMSNSPGGTNNGPWTSGQPCQRRLPALA